MKEKYEKPEIVSENFALEMLKAAGCTCLPQNVERGAAFVNFPGWKCDCGTCTKYNSLS
jgi:hypothetical protein